MGKANDYQIDGDHYKSKIQHWDYVIANNIPYLEAQIIKYVTRWRKKNGEKDLRKAIHFLQKLFESEGIPWSRDVAEGAPTGSQQEDPGKDRVVGRQIPASGTGGSGELYETISGFYRKSGN